MQDMRLHSGQPYTSCIVPYRLVAQRDNPRRPNRKFTPCFRIRKYWESIICPESSSSHQELPLRHDLFTFFAITLPGVHMRVDRLLILGFQFRRIF